MGARSSSLADQGAAPEVWEQQDSLIEQLLTDQCLVWVFELLPLPDVATAALVCQRWCHVATSEDLWLPRLPPALVEALRSEQASPAPAADGQAPAQHPQQGTGALVASVAAHALRTLVGSPPPAALPAAPPSFAALYCRLFKTNLLADPFLRSPARSPWLAPHGGAEWRWEGAQPEGLLLPGNQGPPQLPPPPLPPYSPQGPQRVQHGVVASSHWWGSLLHAPVDLVGGLCRRGLSQAAAESLLDSGAALELSVYVAGRFDCPSLFAVTLSADDGSQSLSAVTPGNLEQWVRGPGMLASATTGQQAAPTQEWARQALVLDSWPAGARPRRSFVLLQGRDELAWAGHYGAKFASPTLRLLPSWPRP